MLLQKSRPAMEALCKIAAGQVVYFRDRDPDTGRRRKLVPSEEAMLQAQKTIIERLLPALKAQELTGANGGPVETNQNVTVFDAARRIAFALELAKRSGIGPSVMVDDLLLTGDRSEDEARAIVEAYTGEPVEPASGEPAAPADLHDARRAAAASEAVARKRPAWLGG